MMSRTTPSESEEGQGTGCGNEQSESVSRERSSRAASISPSLAGSLSIQLSLSYYRIVMPGPLSLLTGFVCTSAVDRVVRACRVSPSYIAGLTRSASASTSIALDQHPL